MAKNIKEPSKLVGKNRAKKFRSFFARDGNWAVQHQGLLCFVLFIALLLALPFAILFLIRQLDLRLSPVAYTRLPDGAGIWLSFWGSYLGCVATIILSIAALRLNEKINKYTWYKNMADEIDSFHQFRVKEIFLYDLSVGIPHEIGCFSQYGNERYLLVISFEPFPPYYEIQPEPLLISSCGVGEKKLDLDSVQSEIINTSEISQLYFVFNSDEITKFALLHIQGANVAPSFQRQRCINIRMRCQNTLYANDPGYYRPFKVDLRIWVVNAKAAQNAGSQLRLGVVRQTVSCCPAV